MVIALVLASLAGLALLLVAWPRPRPTWLRRFLASVGGGNRSALKFLRGQQNDAVILTACFLGQGASVPLNNVGDPNAIWLTMTRQGVGKYTLKTVDPWPPSFLTALTTGSAIQGFDGCIAAATITSHWEVAFGIPSQNSDNTWSVTLQTFSAASGAAPAAADVVLNDLLSVSLTINNSLI